MPLTAGLVAALSLVPLTEKPLVAAARILRRHLPAFKGLPSRVLDTCGTGGDGKSTFNISTAAALVAAAAGVAIAKHGSHAASSKAGSADCLKALGVPIEMDEAMLKRSFSVANFGFFYAPYFHSGLKAVAALRRRLGVRTIFNLLGPLVHPLSAPLQTTGVFSRAVMAPMAKALQMLGVERAWVFHGDDGLDEITLTTTTQVIDVTPAALKSFEINPRDYGLALCAASALRGGDAAENAGITGAILGGHEKGPLRDVVLLNAAAAIVVAGVAPDFRSALESARRAIDSGAAQRGLEALRRL